MGFPTGGSTAASHCHDQNHERAGDDQGAYKHSPQGENLDYHGEWKLDGDVILGVDLANVAYGNVNNEKREAVLRLPQPHLIMAKVDHLRSQQLSIKTRAWIPLSSREVLRDEVWLAGDRKIEQLAQEEPGYTERAKVQAERVLETLFKGVGWTVSFEWENVNPKAKDGPRGSAIDMTANDSR